MPGIDSYTKLMIHCDGADGSTTFTDDSFSPQTVNTVGSAQVDTDITDPFGTNTGCLLCGTASDYITVTDFPDLDLDSADFTFDLWVRFNTLTTFAGFFARYTNSGSYFYCAKEGDNIRIRDYSADTINVTRPYVFSVDTWYHIAVIRTTNTVRLFVNGIQQGADVSVSGSFTARATDLTIGRFLAGSGYYLDGWIDEFRYSKGIARWTTNFTPPTEPYDDNQTASLDETVDISDTWNLQLNPESVIIAETTNISDDWTIQTNPENVTLDDTITLSDSWSIEEFENADYAVKIISVNPLLFVTDTSPAKILKVDITDSENPVVTGATLIGVTNASDVSYNSDTEYIYVSCASGKVVKIDINNLSSQSIIDLSDSDDLQTISTFSAESSTYVSTDDTDGELYLIDERETALIDTNFQYLTNNSFLLETQFNFIEAFFLDTNFQYLQTNQFLLNTDFKWLADTFEEILPYGQEDFHVYVDDIELADDDLVLSSIQIQHQIDGKSEAVFQIARKHDDINSPLSGGTVTLTNQNNIKIYIDTNLEFDGKVSNIKCTYSNELEIVEVTATMTQPADNRKTVTLSLPSIDSSLGLYDILVETPVIYNPYIDSNDDNPEVYKGIRVDLGSRIEQSISRYRFIETIINNKGQIASQIEDGEFEFKQNWQYFWMAKARNVVTGDQWSVSRYIGTSLSSLTSDTWEIIGAPYFRQRQWTDTTIDLGEYTVGSAPYLDVSVKNGELIAVDKWADKDDGFYLEKDESYNYIGKLQLVGDEYQTVEKGYAQKIADLEYSKLLNINGQVLPLTSTDLELTIDTYYYYVLKLLTRINIDNTTSASIFNNNNGFPIAIKSITINSENMRVRLNANNSKSLTELEEIDATYPDEEDKEYLFEAESTRISRKYNPNQDEYVE